MKKFVCAVLLFGASLATSSPQGCRTLLAKMPFALPNAMLASLANDDLYLPEFTPGSKIRQWVKEHLAGGKRLRPMAVYLSSLAMGMETSKVEKLAGVVEQIHLGSLSLDDIIDEAQERRGRPPLHLAEGLTAGVITGPYLQACVFLDCEEHSNAAVRRELARTLKAMGDAEILQRDLKERAPLGGTYTLEEYERVAMGKTGYLFGLSLAISSLHFEKPSGLVQDWLSLGYELGVAYQVKDDFSDAREEPGEINFALLLFSLRKGGSPFRILRDSEYAELLEWQLEEQAARRQKMLGILESIERRVSGLPSPDQGGVFGKLRAMMPYARRARAPQSPDQVAAYETLRDMIEYVTSP